MNWAPSTRARSRRIAASRDPAQRRSGGNGGPATTERASLWCVTCLDARPAGAGRLSGDLPAISPFPPAVPLVPVACVGRTTERRGRSRCRVTHATIWPRERTCSPPRPRRPDRGDLLVRRIGADRRSPAPRRSPVPARQRQALWRPGLPTITGSVPLVAGEGRLRSVGPSGRLRGPGRRLLFRLAGDRLTDRIGLGRCWGQAWSWGCRAGVGG